jgi:hypothetical protein
MALFRKWWCIATEAQGFGKDEEVSMIRDARGNWINEATGELIAKADELEDGDEDENA